MNEDSEGTPLEERVGFYCPRFNLRIEVTHPKSLTDDPAAAQHPDRKMVQFSEGFYSTDDPEIIKALDKRDDVYRMDDPRVQALEETTGMEPEEREKALRLLQKVGGVGEFSKRRATVPGIISAPRE